MQVGRQTLLPENMLNPTGKTRPRNQASPKQTR